MATKTTQGEQVNGFTRIPVVDGAEGFVEMLNNNGVSMQRL